MTEYIDPARIEAMEVAMELFGADAYVGDLTDLADWLLEDYYPASDSEGPVAVPAGTTHAELTIEVANVPDKPLPDWERELLAAVEADRKKARAELVPGQVISPEDAAGLPVGSTFEDADGDLWEITERGYTFSETLAYDADPAYSTPLTLRSLPEPEELCAMAPYA